MLSSALLSPFGQRPRKRYPTHRTGRNSRKRQYVENGDVLADIGEIDPGHRNAQSPVRPFGLVLDRFPAVEAPIWPARWAR